MEVFLVTSTGAERFTQPTHISPSPPNALCFQRKGQGTTGDSRREGDTWPPEGDMSTHLPYFLEVELRKCVQPVGQLAQVEKLHLEAGDKGASHTGGVEKHVPVIFATHGREAQGPGLCEKPGQERGMEKGRLVGQHRAT